MTFLSIKKQMEIISKNVTEIVPEEDLIKKLELSKNKNIPLIIKLGCDPSRPDLHIGHSVVLRKLRQFQDLGHTAVLVIGDFTAMIGDPSGRNKTRPQLTSDQARVYAETYVQQAGAILNIKKLKVVYNSDWLSKMNFVKVIELASKYTVARMIERDDFTKRYNDEIPIFIHEFLYPLAQAMDSVKLKADVELGGTDQKFNLLVGRDLQREYGLNPQVIITNPLLEGTDGVEKMSKSYNNHISLNDTPEEMYGKTMSIPDKMIGKYFKLAANVSISMQKKINSELQNPKINPRDLKRNLARAIIELYYDKNSANKGEKYFDKIFIKKDIPDNIVKVSINKKLFLIDFLLNQKLIKSKSEGRRLIKQNAVKVNNELCSDIYFCVHPKSNYIVKIGKRRFIEIS